MNKKDEKESKKAVTYTSSPFHGFHSASCCNKQVPRSHDKSFRVFGQLEGKMFDHKYQLDTLSGSKFSPLQLDENNKMRQPNQMKARWAKHFAIILALEETSHENRSDVDNALPVMNRKWEDDNRKTQFEWHRIDFNSCQKNLYCNMDDVIRYPFSHQGKLKWVGWPKTVQKTEKSHKAQAERSRTAEQMVHSAYKDRPFVNGTVCFVYACMDMERMPGSFVSFCFDFCTVPLYFLQALSIIIIIPVIYQRSHRIPGGQT